MASLKQARHRRHLVDMDLHPTDDVVFILELNCRDPSANAGYVTAVSFIETNDTVLLGESKTVNPHMVSDLDLGLHGALSLL
jgi:hypothetical protein